MLARTCLKKGAGIPLVFLHGFLGTASDWEPVCDFLPPCHCIGLDLPGHGKSPFTENFDIDIPLFHLIGYSMGGRLAMQYADSHPEKIASLTVMSAHPGLLTDEEKQKKLEADASWAKLLFELPIDDFLDRWYDQPLFKPFKPDLSMRKQQNIPHLAAALIHYSSGKQKRYEIEEGFAGERDTNYHHLYKKTILIPNAGHAVHLENPEAVAMALQQRIFL